MNKNKFKQLGRKITKYPSSPKEAELETFANRNKENDYLVPFICNEFTTLCPITNQPDFAKIELVYAPDKLCLESKSFKIYLFSFRNCGNFHEDVANKIFNDLWKLLKPKYMRIWADFYARGGISIKPMVIRFNGKISEENKEEINKLVKNYDRRAYFNKN